MVRSPDVGLPGHAITGIRGSRDFPGEIPTKQIWRASLHMLSANLRLQAPEMSEGSSAGVIFVVRRGRIGCVGSLWRVLLRNQGNNRELHHHLVVLALIVTGKAQVWRGAFSNSLYLANRELGTPNRKWERWEPAAIAGMAGLRSGSTDNAMRARA